MCFVPANSVDQQASAAIFRVRDLMGPPPHAAHQFAAWRARRIRLGVAHENLNEGLLPGQQVRSGTDGFWRTPARLPFRRGWPEADGLVFIDLRHARLGRPDRAGPLCCDGLNLAKRATMPIPSAG